MTKNDQKHFYVPKATNLADAFAYNDDLVGKPNLIIGTKVDDVLVGTRGADIVYAYAGNDRISTGLGNDTIYAGSGNDTINAGGGNDLIYAGEGNDYIALSRDIDNSTGNDTVYGGDGNDLVFIGLSRGNATIFTGAGNDTVRSFIDEGAHFIDFGDGDDVYEAIELAFGPSTLLFGNGNDVMVDNGGFSTTYTAALIDGGAGNDSLRGSMQNDTIYGGDGNDTIISGNGNDVISGGTGSDIFFFDLYSNDEIISDFSVGSDRIGLSSGTNLAFSDLIISQTEVGALVSIRPEINSDISIQLIGVKANQLTADSFTFS